MFIIFALGPCEPLIPHLMVPAAEHNSAGVILIATIFGGVTVATMLTIVLLVSFGFKSFSMGKLEKYTHVMAGATIFLSGCAIVFLGW